MSSEIPLLTSSDLIYTTLLPNVELYFMSFEGYSVKEDQLWYNFKLYPTYSRNKLWKKEKMTEKKTKFILLNLRKTTYIKDTKKKPRSYILTYHVAVPHS